MGQVLKGSNAGGGSNLFRYNTFLAGNSSFIPGAFNSIQTVFYSTSSGGDVVFSSIPNNYRHLQVRIFARDTRAAVDSTWFMQFNSDTGNNYSYQGMNANGSSISSISSLNTNSMQGIVSGANSGSSRYGAAVIDVFDSNQTNKYKSVSYQSGYTNNGSGNIYTVAGTWRSQSAISTITIKPNTAFAQYSHIALYGIL
jgi:hypothetical protein